MQLHIPIHGANGADVTARDLLYIPQLIIPETLSMLIKSFLFQALKSSSVKVITIAGRISSTASRLRSEALLFPLFPGSLEGDVPKDGGRRATLPLREPFY